MTASTRPEGRRWAQERRATQILHHRQGDPRFGGMHEDRLHRSVQIGAVDPGPRNLPPWSQADPFGRADDFLRACEDQVKAPGQIQDGGKDQWHGLKDAGVHEDVAVVQRPGGIGQT